MSCLAACACLSARAQWLTPEAVGGAFWGGLIGGLVGGDCRHGFSWNSAAVGAGIGLAAGGLFGEARRYEAPRTAVYLPAPEPSVVVGYGYPVHGQAVYVYDAPNAYCAPSWYYRPARPNYTLGGTVLGAASGALIGAGTGDAGKGAAIGAAAGLLVGAITESAVRQQEQPRGVTAAPLPTPPSAPATPSSSPAESRSHITSQPGPDSTYFWTPRPQIADAPPVPDAPRF